jgi:omega-6 fatty acid desaturase (delta-12 desaturase)
MVDVSWKTTVAKYQIPSMGRSIWQIVNSFIPYIFIWYLLYKSLPISYWLAIPLMILAAGFMVRLFIIHHDCGHGSFFLSRMTNDFWGFITGVLTLTPYYLWRWEHAIHHASSGNLDRRGTGDVWTLTVHEYLKSTKLKRFAYKLVRNPIILFLIAPIFLFAVKHRFCLSKGASKRERQSVYWTNLGILLIAIIMSLIFGWKQYLLIQLGITAISSSLGVWLFYVQHQFEGVYWKRNKKWDYLTASLEGSSFYKLPKILQWFSGNIGFHHIHHLSPRIPNYNLEKCHKAEPLFQSISPITLLKSFKSLKFRLWDEEHHKLVGYKKIHKKNNSA